MPRLVNVPTQKVYGDFPLELPLIKMSEGEALWLGREPQIYDKDYPLNYSGLHFNTAWDADTGTGGSFMGDVYSPLNKGDMGDYVDGGIGGGNVAMHPSDYAPGGYAYVNGMGYLGLTPAQQRAETARLLRLQAVQNRQDRKPTKPTKPVTSNLNPVRGRTNDDAAQTACTTAGGVWNRNKQTCNYAQPTRTCTRGGGTWDATTNTCTQGTSQKPTSGRTNDDTAQSACNTAGGVWNRNRQSCNYTKPTRTCTRGGGTWDATTNTCTQATDPKQLQCTQTGGTYANGVCTAATDPNQLRCTQDGGTWANGVCAPQKLTPQQECERTADAYWDGTRCQGERESNPNTPDPRIAQCTQGGGYWDGATCQQQRGNYQGGGGGPQGGGGGPTGGGNANTRPIPDGQGYGGPPPQQGGGGGFQMTQSPSGPGGQFDEQASQFQTAQSPTPLDETEDQSSGTDTDTPKDEASGVAAGNIFESVVKMFSGGMNGTECGMDAPYGWIGMGGGNNPPAPRQPQTTQYAVRQTTEPINPSTIIGVLAASAALVAGSAAIFLWATGKK